MFYRSDNRAPMRASVDAGCSWRAELTELYLLYAGVSTVIWATGYDLDYGWIEAPILDELSYARNVRGVTTIRGLYFLGLLWQHSQASASLVGPQLGGLHLMETMARRARHPVKPPSRAA